MRYLLTAASKPARRSVAAAAIESSSSYPPSAVWNAPAIASKEKENHAGNSAQETTTNFGQQCGPHCGCVVRLELDVSADNDQKVQTGQYTAKRVLLAKNGTPLRTSKGRLQYTPSSCATLHRLLPQVIQFFQNKSLAKLQTYTDFCGHRSSPAFGQAVLQQHGLLVAGANNNKNNNKRGCAACFDLVEDVVTAAVRGYLPAPRRKPPRNNPNRYPGVEDDDDDDDYYQETAAAAASPPTSLREQATADWTASLLWPFSSRDNDETAATYSHFSTGNVSTTAEPEIQQPSKWTALDWIDYWEQQQQQQEEEEQVKQKEGGSTQQEENEQAVRDWLSYVDLLRRREDESA